MNAIDLLAVLRGSYERILKPRRVMVAFSGGADSMALLCLMKELGEQERFELSCVHVNHSLRLNADREERFAVKAASSLGVPILVKRVQVKTGGNLEAAARKARYDALLQSKRELNADVIAIAHHAQDQAETMLMNLARGCGPDGLAGMTEFRYPYWRPLLLTGKPALLAYLGKKAVGWVEDESNQDIRFLRNEIRLKMFPLLEAHFPGIAERFANTAALLGCENEYIEQDAATWLKHNTRLVKPFVFILREPFFALHLAMKRRVLRRFCLQQKIILDAETTERLVNLSDSNYIGTINLPDQAYACFTAKRLHIWADDVESFSVYWWQPLAQDSGQGLGDGARVQVVDYDAVQGAVMRQVQAGDRISPLGMPGSQPLRKYLGARGIDKPFRAYWPVYARGNEVLWVPGCGISRFAAVTGSTGNPKRLVMEQELPHEIS